MKIAMIFPGQGSQYVGMGKNLCEKYEIARKTFQEANEALNFDLQKLCFEGDMEELTKTENSQPAILTVSVAAYRVYMEKIGVPPTLMAGHSLGEYSALVCAGSMEFADAVKIVRQRGLFMQDAVPVGVGAMAAIGDLDRELVEEECEKYSKANDKVVVVSNYNGKKQLVISGHKEAVEELGEIFAEMDGLVIPLKVSAPFHCPMMKPAADNLEQELKKYNYNDIAYPVISNVHVKPYESKDAIIDNLASQVVEPVRWYDTIKYFEEQGIEMAIELGPKTVLKKLMKKNAKDISTYSFDKENDWKNITRKLIISEHNEYTECNLMPVITKCMAVAVSTKNSNFNNEEYQDGVIEPYRRIKEIQEDIEENGVNPSKEQAQEALDMLKTVFDTKKTPIEEQKDRFNQIFEATGTGDIFDSVLK